MKRLETVQTTTISTRLLTPTMIRSSLSESEILSLQDCFLINGFQYIKVHDIITGRSIIEGFLDSLQHHHAVACLTLDAKPLKEGTFDIFQAFSAEKLFITDNFDDFFMQEYYFDFIWIEKTPELLKSSWYFSFEQKLMTGNLSNQIPIVLVDYLKMYKNSSSL